MRERADRQASYTTGITRGMSVMALAVVIIGAGACRQDMHDQPRYEPLEGSTFFTDGRASRPLVPGTVHRGSLPADPHLKTGRIGDDWAETFPFPVSREVMNRGRERYEIFCAPCHGRTGDGNGMVVRRGFPPARSFHDERLRQEKVGYYFDTITKGFGRMQSYAAQIPTRDRWAIIAWIRALQLSRHAPVDELSPEQRRQVEAGGDS